MENLYEFPFYFIDIKSKVSEYLTNIESKKIKRKEKSKQDVLSTSSNKKEKPYRLIVEFIGKKNGKKVKFGISKLAIGTEFGGHEYKHLKLKCGNCKKKRFVIEDNENKILRCANCGALNSIFSEDLTYFE